MSLRDLPRNKVAVLRNLRCPYCGVQLTARASYDHMIGRRFVPRGKLDGGWNLKVRACDPCNNRKSDLEDDISAISMQPDLVRGFAADDEVLASEAGRKAGRSVSRRTGMAVAASSGKINLNYSLGPGATMSFEMLSPPQLDEARVFELAHFHLRALFYLVTYNDSQRTGFWWPGGCFPVDYSIRTNWGNSPQRDFMRAVERWEPRFLANGLAGGFFKAVLRRHPSAECWAWALEWNQKLRVIGFSGNQEAAEAIVATFSPPVLHVVAEEPGVAYRLGQEVALADSDDVLFTFAGEVEGDPDRGSPTG